jgi:hypothetical protein
MFQEEESEAALLQREDSTKKSEPETEDIPGYLNQIIKLCLVIPLLIYQYCFEWFFKFSFSIMGWVLNKTDRIPIIGKPWNSLRTWIGSHIKQRLKPLFSKTKTD